MEGKITKKGPYVMEMPREARRRHDANRGGDKISQNGRLVRLQAHGQAAVLRRRTQQAATGQMKR
jgi:hypothetical protein